MGGGGSVPNLYPANEKAEIIEKMQAVATAEVSASRPLGGGGRWELYVGVYVGCFVDNSIFQTLINSLFYIYSCFTHVDFFTIDFV